jgi:hypothetical protein
MFSKKALLAFYNLRGFFFDKELSVKIRPFYVKKFFKKYKKIRLKK